MMSYDPAFTNTASCTSKITFIDGDKGILRYRGYSIEELAEKSTYLETAYLILHGELPTQAQLDGLDLPRHAPHFHSREHQEISRRISLRRPSDGHADFDGGGAFHFLSGREGYFQSRNRGSKQTYRLIGKMPTLAAFAYRHSLGMPFVYPDNELSYRGNFLNMLFRTTELKYRPNPTLERALDILFILHADHEQNCSSTAMRVRGQLACGSVFGHRGGHRCALWAAARRRERSSAAHAGGYRLGDERSRRTSRA